MRNKLIIVVALVFGLIASFLAYNYLNSVNEEAEKRVYTQVVIATQDIPSNTTITAEMVELKPFPSELSTSHEMVNVQEAVGRLTVVAISKGEVLLQGRLIKPGEGTDKLAYVVPEGYRAISVPVDEVSGVAFMLEKGDHVDIISVIEGTDPAVGPRSVVVLQNIVILAIGTEVSPPSVGAEKPKTVTLSVTQADSLPLKMAMQKGGVSLVLRSPADKKIGAPAPFGLNQF